MSTSAAPEPAGPARPADDCATTGSPGGEAAAASPGEGDVAAAGPGEGDAPPEIRDAAAAVGAGEAPETGDAGAAEREAAGNAGAPSGGGSDEPGESPHSRRRLLVRVLAITLAVLVLVGVATAVGAKILLDRYTGTVHQDALLGGSGAAAGRTNFMTVAGPLNILLVGIDARGDPGETVRADSIIILHVPASHDRAYLVSIPRDADVHIPASARAHFAGGRAKVNAAFAFGSRDGGGRAGGFQLLAATLTELTGIHFDAGAIVDFGGFKEIVDALGGVDMCVDEKVTSIHIGTDASGHHTKPYEETPSGGLVRIAGVTPQVYEPGCRRMSGWQALDYVRQRKLLPDGDYGRERHQQQFLRAMLAKATRSGLAGDPGRLDRVLRAAGAALTVDAGGVPFVDWVYTLRNLSSERLTLVKTNGGQFQSFWAGGELRERLIPDSLALLRAVRADRVDAFLATHPTWGDAPAQPSSRARVG